ncbi:MAG: LysR family transcriptional regulator [Clostridia bacterium]|jgi:molybdate transport system regulatory protein|nr:LysR family transcriptional regulator [Clostridia bacterium]
MNEKCKLSFKNCMRLYRNGKKAFGPGIAMLLELTEQYGTLSAAAAEMELAYSKAWRILNECEDVLGVRLLERNRGGKNGGGVFLTDAGRNVLQNYRKFCSEAEGKNTEIFNKYFNGE